jgi:hypothetical protein
MIRGICVFPAHAAGSGSPDPGNSCPDGNDPSPYAPVVAAIFGSTSQNPNNFGRFLLLHNLHGISIFSSAFITGSTCNIIAAGLIYRDVG